MNGLIARRARRFVITLGGAGLALQCALPGFTIVEGDGSGGLGGEGGDSSGGSGSGGRSSGGNGSGGVGSGGVGSGASNTGGFGGEGGDGSGGTASGGNGSGGDGSGGGSPCGALDELCCDSGPNGGCNAPYECEGDTCEDLRTWQVQQKLLAVLPGNAADGAMDDYFGYTVAVSGDTAVVGSPYDDDQGDSSGSAYVFMRSGSTWGVQAKLTAQLPGGNADGAADDVFGYSVAISGDTIVVGSLQDDDQGASSGSAYVFVRNGTTWNIQQKLTAVLPGATPDGAPGDLFGGSVAVSGDTAIIGSLYDDHSQGGDAGSAYVFVRSGSVWTIQQKLTAALPGAGPDGAAGDYFGNAVALSGDTAVIGSRMDDDNGSASGSAYVFVRSGSTWAAQAKLTATLPSGEPDGAANDVFGQSVAISGDTVVIGSSTDDDQGNQSGSAYVFMRDGSTWSPQQKLLAALPEGTPDGAANDLFGISVSLSGDVALIGCNKNGIPPGAAYAFVRHGSTWSVQQKLGPPPGDTGSNFGYSVALSGDTAIVAAYGDSDQGSNAGAAYTFAFE